MATQAQIDANKKNALKSTGPKTAAGKARARFNGLKHGMRAETIVLPTEDPAEFAAELQAWNDDWKPPTAARKILVERGAVAAWRLRRSVRVETSRLDKLSREALKHHQQAMTDQNADAIRWLIADPLKALAVLNKTYEGVVEQIAMWQFLVDSALDPTHWHNLADHHTRLMNLLGWKPSQVADDHKASSLSLRLYHFNNPEIADPHGPITAAQASQIARDLHKLLTGEIEALRETLARFEPLQISHDRIMESAYLDASPEGKCLMRYEAQHDRSLRASISQLIQLSKTGADLAGWEDEQSTEPNPALNPLNKTIYAKSNFPKSDPHPPTKFNSLIEAQLDALMAANASTNRDQSGRIWPILDPSKAPQDQSNQ